MSVAVFSKPILDYSRYYTRLPPVNIANPLETEVARDIALVLQVGLAPTINSPSHPSEPSSSVATGGWAFPWLHENNCDYLWRGTVFDVHIIKEQILSHPLKLHPNPAIARSELLFS